MVEKLSSIIGIIIGVGVFVSVCAGIYLGIKYMISSVDERADIKKKMIPFITGVGIFYGAFGILALIANFAKMFE